MIQIHLTGTAFLFACKNTHPGHITLGRSPGDRHTVSQNELLDRADSGKASVVIADLLYTAVYILSGPPIICKSFQVWNLDHTEWELWK